MNNTTTSPISFTEDHPCLEIPEWQSLNGGLLRPLEASRHYLVLGETGSGKTLSAIRPWLRAAWAYPSEQEYRRYAASVEATGQVPESMEELNPGMLVIDPKGELKEFILHEQPKFPVGRKLIFLDIASPHYVIPWFDPAEAVQTDAYTIAARMLSLSAYMTREGYSRDPFWGKEAQDIIKALLSIDHAIVKQKKIRGLKLFWERVHDGVISNLKEWHAKGGGETRARQFQDLYDKFNNSLSELKASSVRLRLHLDEDEVPDCLLDLDQAIDSFPKARDDHDRGMVYDTLLDCLDALSTWRRRKVLLLGASQETARLAEDVLTHGAQCRMYGEQLADWDPSGPEQDPGIDEDLRSLDLRYDRSCYLRPHFRLLNLSSTYHREQPAGDPVLDAYLKAARKYEVPAESLLRIRQLISLADKTYSSIIAVINGVLNELTSPELAACLCLNPYEMPVKDRCLDVAQVVKEGAWLLFNPGIGRNSAIGDIVARALKTKFFETALSRTNKIRPLMYVADEFQRYLTGDAESSEALFLDRCRAYRVCCVLATQSLASLRYGLSASDQTGSGSAAMEAALQILINTTANKFFFRNTDPLTQEWLKTMIPECPRPGRPHLLDVRPVSSLKIGECYCLLGDGTYGLGKAAVESHPPVLKHKDFVAPSTRRKKTR